MKILGQIFWEGKLIYHPLNAQPFQKMFRYESTEDIPENCRQVSTNKKTLARNMTIEVLAG